jgi:hypothetical protein
MTPATRAQLYGGLSAFRDESRYFFNARCFRPSTRPPTCVRSTRATPRRRSPQPTLRAPAKQGVWFERSSHMIPCEEPGKMLLSLVQAVRPLVEPNKNRR